VAIVGGSGSVEVREYTPADRVSSRLPPHLRMNVTGAQMYRGHRPFLFRVLWIIFAQFTNHNAVELQAQFAGM
jgi:hypothetical protein